MYKSVSISPKYSEDRLAAKRIELIAQKIRSIYFVPMNETKGRLVIKANERTIMDSMVSKNKKRLRYDLNECFTEKGEIDITIFYLYVAGSSMVDKNVLNILFSYE